MKDKKMRITFIVNPISGTHSKEGIAELIEKNLSKDGFEKNIVFTEYAGHAAEIAKACVTRIQRWASFPAEAETDWLGTCASLWM